MAKKRKITVQNAGKLAFSQFVDVLKKTTGTEWSCCNATFSALRDIHKHVAIYHRTNVDAMKQKLLAELNKKDECQLKKIRLSTDSVLPNCLTEQDEFKWLPFFRNDSCSQKEDTKGQILLFYHYRWIDNTQHVLSWQKELCRRLNLTGKIRIAKEGLNATVGGTYPATEIYIQAVLNHPFFCEMTKDDFKTSEGSADNFPEGLKVGIFKEVCPMGVDPEQVPFSKGGTHISPDEFHNAIDSHVKKQAESQKLFVDCRNFYESKIGAFEGAVRPDIRKFSYWPEYVDKNTELFKDKTVYMYCTGGIRCERGSAYLKSKGICKDVLQLSGGIHKYMEKHPDGYFRGKLFVFDNRYHIQSNDDVISKCTYCCSPWDSYKPCTSDHCHQFVLSCTECRDKSFTTCCKTCQKHADAFERKEQCECTHKRHRIPIESK